jgi:endosialidase-like protein
MKCMGAFSVWAGVCLVGAGGLAAQEMKPRAVTPESPAVKGPAVGVVNPQAIVPRFVKFSGTLQDMAGKPLVGVADVTFALYTEEAGGTALWYETQTVETDALGRYTVLLGAMHAGGVPVEMFTSGEARWLGVQVGNLPETAQGGRVLLVSVPYALKALDAETLGGKPASAFMLAPDQTGSQTTNPSAPGAPTTNIKTSGKKPKPLAMTSGATNFVDTTADQVVLVQQNGTGMGLLATAPSNVAIEGTTAGTSNGIVAGLYGVSTGATGSGKGIWGTAGGTGGVGVYGSATATTGTTYGILGFDISSSGTGLLGEATSTTGPTVGVAGYSYSTSGRGIWGLNQATSGATTGILAEVLSPSGTGLVVNNVAGGKLASMQNNGVEKLSVDGSGSITTTGNLSAGNLNAVNLTALGTVSDANEIVAGDINLPLTTGLGVGVITLGGAPFIHTCCGNTYNTFVGLNAGNLTTTGASNTATGYGALQSNSYGGNNTASGFFTLVTNTTGENNTASGFSALESNTTGNYNTASGFQALVSNITGTYNTASGVAALFLNDTGGHDSAFGTCALANTFGTTGMTGPCGGVPTLTSGSGDTAVGFSAGRTNTTGQANTFLGFGADASSGTLSNATAIGAYAVVGESNALVLGSINGFNGATSSVNVGIGTSTPGHALDVVGDINASGCVVATGTTLGGTCSSDARLKTNIQPFAPVLDKVARLQPVHFNWRASNPVGYGFGPGESAGLIAQQVEKVFPNMVSTDARGYKMVNYSELPYLLPEGVRELKAQNDTLRKRMSDQQTELRHARDENHAEQAEILKLTRQVRELRLEQTEISLFKARLDRLERQEGSTRTARARTTSKPKNTAHAEVARLGN